MLESAWGYLQQGGWVMVPLLGVSLILWALVAERWQFLHGLKKDDLDLAGVLAVCRGQRTLARATGLRSRLAASFVGARTGRAPLDRQVLAHLADRLDRQLERRHEAIGALAGVAPLLGLLGTVLGMIETFQVISTFGTGNAQAMAEGISVALITTQTGLLVAIPGLLESGRLRRQTEQLRLCLAETTQMIDRDLARRATATAPTAARSPENERTTES